MASFPLPCITVVASPHSVAQSARMSPHKKGGEIGRFVLSQYSLFRSVLSLSLSLSPSLHPSLSLSLTIRLCKHSKGNLSRKPNPRPADSSQHRKRPLNLDRSFKQFTASTGR